VRDPVRPRQMIDRVQGNDVADHRISAAVARELGLDRGDRAVAGHTEPRSMALIAIGRRRQEVLATCLDPLHRPPEPSRHRRQQHVLGIHVPLGAEAAADVRRDDPYLLFREAQGCSDRRAHGERHLGRRPDRQPAVGRLRLGEDAARLDRHRPDTRHVEPRFDDHLRLGEAADDVADGSVGRPGGVVGPLVEDPRRARRQCRVDGDRRGQHVVANVDHGGAVGGAIDVVGDHHRDGLAGVARLRARDRRLCVRPEPGRWHERRHRRHALRQLGDRENRDDSRQRQRAVRVDSENAGVGVGTSHDGRVQQIGKAQVVHVATPSGEETTIFAAFDGKADRRGHEIVVKVVAV